MPSNISKIYTVYSKLSSPPKKRLVRSLRGHGLWSHIRSAIPIHQHLHNQQLHVGRDANVLFVKQKLVIIDKRQYNHVIIDFMNYNNTIIVFHLKQLKENIPQLVSYSRVRYKTMSTAISNGISTVTCTKWCPFYSVYLVYVTIIEFYMEFKIELRTDCWPCKMSERVGNNETVNPSQQLSNAAL